MMMRRLNDKLEAELIDVAGCLADCARQATLEHFRSDRLVADNKGVDVWDPVTKADKRCELRMREILAERRPDDGILGEEFKSHQGESGLVWVLDPIDGTRSYICGTPVWGVLIAVSDDQGPLYGIIDQPYIGERFEGGFGRSQFCRGPGETRPLSVRHTHQLKNAKLFTTMPEIGTESERSAFKRVKKRVQSTRYGIDCYAYALLALGQIDLVIEAGLKPYDIHAPIAVVSAAGGIVTDWEGGGEAHHGGRVVAAANAAIHQQALATLAWAKKLSADG